MSKRLRDAVHAAAAAERTVADVLRQDYRIGSVIHWQRGADCTSTIFRGYVVMHGYGRRVKVCNERSGRHYWIRAAQVYPE